MSKCPGRRRFLAICAAAGAAGAVGLAWFGRERLAQERRLAVHEWRGTALGAEASIRLFHADATAAKSILDRCVVEIGRVESLFSLFRTDSCLARLNAAGGLAAAPADFVYLLGVALSLARLSGDRFDPTVQPLWDLYARHFAKLPRPAEGPPAAAIERARALVDHRAVTVKGRDVSFARDGMAITLNGIAQGFLTDRIASFLRAAGFGAALVETGETYALGRHPSGRPWRIGLAAAGSAGRLSRTIAIADRAVSTSAGDGTAFDPSGRFHHIFDPATGRSADRYRSVSVAAPTATLADGLSTALYVMPLADGRVLIEALPGTQAWLTRTDGTVVTLPGA